MEYEDLSEANQREVFQVSYFLVELIHQAHSS